MERKYEEPVGYRGFKKKEELELERQERLIKGLKVIAVVGIGSGLYGFKLGRRSGIRRGIELGYIAAGNEFITAFTDWTNESKLSRGE